MARRTHRVTWRLTVLILALLVAALGVVARLVQVQVLDHNYYQAEARDEHEQTTVVHAPRGAILDRNGYPLATRMKTFDVYIDPRVWASDLDALTGASVVAPLLGRDPAELIVATRLQAEGDYIAARQVDAQSGLQILQQAPPGVQAVETSSRFHPEGDMASLLLGFTGRDETGLTGIEADFDHELGGTPGLVYVERDGRGQPIPFGRKVGTQPKAGGDVQLTIDRYIQSLVEQKLDQTIERNKASGATIIVMDPKTGEILALASRPSFQFSKLNLDDPSQAELYRNRPVTDLYEPGSVMKTITMATAIDLGLVNPNTTYFDTGQAEVEGGAPIKNWDFSAHGTTTMTQVLQYSLNTGAVWLARQIGADRLYNSFNAFGFGEPTGIGLGGEAAGIVRTNQDDGWYPVDLATNSFGQGINMTPIQMIAAISSLVNGGQLMRPYIVKEVSGPDGLRTYEPVVVRRTISEETSRTLVQMMEAVVDGQPGHQAQVPGYRVGGKTGTTTYPDKIDTIASFVGFAPAADPKFIMLVRIDSPRDSLGGVIAAPVFSESRAEDTQVPRCGAGTVITAHEVTENLGSLLQQQRGPKSARFRGVVIDSRQAGPSDLFVALRGERTDGQRFAADAVERGARGLLLREAIDAPPGVTSFVVPDTLLALQRLAAGRRDRRRAKVVGITGSVGKTTTKEIVASVLGVKYRVLKSEANYNNEIGLPLTLLKLTNRHQRAVLEMGMYALGEIRTLCEIARPEIGVVTNVGPVHLERLGSMEAIAAAKAELLESLPLHGFAVMNVDDPFVRAMGDRTRARPLFYGLSESADVRATDVTSRGLGGVSFRLHHENQNVAVETKLPGRHIVSNALAAAAVGLADGMALDDVARGLATADVQVRIRTHRGLNGATLIDDTYNASPASMLAALDLLAEIPGRRIAVLGDMAELGAASKEGHLTVGRRAAETASVIHAVGVEAALIAQAARAAGHRDVHHWLTKEEAGAALLAGLRADDVVLLKASRALAFETLVEALAE